jgi:hypothetical protein
MGKKIDIKHKMMLNFMNYTIAIYKVDIPVRITLFPFDVARKNIVI